MISLYFLQTDRCREFHRKRIHILGPIFAALVTILLYACPLSAEERLLIKAVTTDEAFPYNFKKNQKITGLATDIVEELVKRSGYRLEVEVLPWTRALQTAKVEANVMVYSLVKNAEREQSYYWIGPISNSEVWLFKLSKRTDIVLSSLADIQKYQIGDVASSAIIPILREAGGKVDTAPSNLSNCKKLSIGRIDLIPFEPLGINRFLEGCDLQLNDIEKVLYVPRDTALYIALGKSTSSILVDRLNAEYTAMLKDKTIERINRKWGVEYKAVIKPNSP